MGIATLTFGITLGVLASHGLGVPDPSARHLDGIGVLLAMASTLPLAARRLAPFTVYLVTAAASLALGLVILLFRQKNTLDADAWRELKG